MAVNTRNTAIVTLDFAFDTDDDWPPVAVESLRFSAGIGGHELLTPPLFVKDLSVGDVIHAELRRGNLVASWRHMKRSDRSTIWLLRLEESGEIDRALAELRTLGCDAAGVEAAGCYAVDVPSDVPMKLVHAVLESLNPEQVAVTFPSVRHSSGSKAAGDERTHATSS